MDSAGVRNPRKHSDSVNILKRLQQVQRLKIPHVRNDKHYPWRCIGKERKGAIYKFAFAVPPGMSVVEMEGQQDALAAAVGAHIEIEDYGGAVAISVFTEDFARTLPYNGKAFEPNRLLLGYNRAHEPITHTLNVPHMLIAGQSGYGKTDCLRWLLWQLIATHSPNRLHIDIIDMKGFSFLPFRNVPHIRRVARDLAGALDILTDTHQLMRARAKEIWQADDRSLATAQTLRLVIIDEAAQIAPKLISNRPRKKVADACNEAAGSISSVGREARVGLWYCTQRPDAEVINPLIKANIDAKLCFRTQTESNSRIVLDVPGAEQLPHGTPGRALYATDSLEEIQIPYIGNDEKWREVLNPYEQAREKTPRHSESAAGGPDPVGRKLEPAFPRAWQPGEEVFGAADDNGEG